MATKIRKQIYLEPLQEARLKHLAGATGMPEAEIIRQALDLHLQRTRVLRRDPQIWARERAYLAQLAATGTASQPRTWSREDLYER